MVEPKDKLGDFEVLARLNAGGMAQLYLARRRGAGGFAKPVALKVIHEHLADDPEFVKMFVDEATLSSKIDAPNTVHIEELGKIGETWFLAMEYIHGASLGQMLKAVASKDRRISSELAVYIAAEVAAGLHAAHETTDANGTPLGIVHRDVSPQNILLSHRGHVKVIDFGIAKALNQVSSVRSEPLRGKIAYMAPEQARGEDYDRRADIYALGIVLWEMLTCSALFRAENDFALLDLVRDPHIEPPGRVVEGISPALDAMVMRVLARRPEDRPATALELRRGLLEAVPEARRVEPDDLAALLRATVGDEMADRAKHLPRASEATQSVVDLGDLEPTTSSPAQELAALQQLTLPGLTLSSGPTLPPPPEPRAERHVPKVVWGVVAALTLFLLTAVGFRVARPGEVKATMQPAPEASAMPSPPASTAPPTPPAPTVIEPPPLESSKAASPASAPPQSAPPSSKRPVKPVTRPAPSAKKPTPGAPCRKIGGVELCE